MKEGLDEEPVLPDPYKKMSKFKGFAPRRWLAYILYNSAFILSQ